MIVVKQKLPLKKCFWKKSIAQNASQKKKMGMLMYVMFWVMKM